MDNRTCTVIEDGKRCTRPYHCRDMCRVHYQRLNRHGSPYFADIPVRIPPRRGPVEPDLPGEHWLPVPGYEGLYEVSDKGRVKSLPRRRVAGRLMKPQRGNALGYAALGLYKRDVRTAYYVHHLVLLAFVGPRPDGLEVRHLDGDDLNNALDNLVYGTSAENKADIVRHGRHHYGNRTHCDNGHEFTEENTRIDLRPDGSFERRACRKCANDSSRRSMEHRTETAPPCTEDDCELPQVAKGLCHKHYSRQWWRAHHQPESGAAEVA